MIVQVCMAHLIQLRIRRTADYDVVVVLIAAKIDGVHRRSQLHVDRKAPRSEPSQRNAEIGIGAHDNVAQRRPKLIDGLSVLRFNLTPSFLDVRLLVKLANEISEAGHRAGVGWQQFLAYGSLQRRRIGQGNS